MLSMTMSEKSISFFPGRMCGLRLLAMFPRDDGNHRKTALLRAACHFHWYRTDPAGRNDDEGIIRPEFKSVQNLIGVAFVFFQVQRRTQSVRADDRRVI